jgi:hypothetical protein
MHSAKMSYPAVVWTTPGILRAVSRIATRNKRAYLSATRPVQRRAISTAPILRCLSNELPTPEERRYRNTEELLDHLVPEEYRPQTVLVTNTPLFAIEEDIRELFEEGGIPV